MQSRPQLAIPLFCLLFLLACGSSAPPPAVPGTSCTDLDGDTFAVEGGVCGLVDCDDTLPAVHPGAEERFHGDPACADALDNDCNGLVDRDDPGCQQDATCTTHADCDDGTFCNGAEICVAGACRAGPNPCPDDGLYCNGTELCSEAADSCFHAGAPCSDGNGCTDDRCDEAANTCSHACAAGDGQDPCCDDAACADAPVCEQGACTVDADCDDLDPCTVDVCAEATRSCTHTCNAAGPQSACCSSSPTCAPAPVCQGACRSDGDCSDGAFCNGVERCLSGACVPGTPVTCNDSNICSTDACDEAADTCTHTCNAQYGGDVCCNNAACNGAAVCEIECLTDGDCNDGAFCNGVERCEASVCITGTVPCDDGDPCTTDTCSEADDACTSQCGAGAPDDVCCEVSACGASAACAGEPFPGGSPSFRMTGLAQTLDGAQGSCLLEQNLLHLILPLISGQAFPVDLPAGTPDAVVIRLPLPFLGTISLTASFGENALVFPEQPVEGIDLGEVPGAGLFGLNCVIGGRAAGDITPLDGDMLPATIRIRDVTVEAGLPSHGSCDLETPDPACTLEITLEGR